MAETRTSVGVIIACLLGAVPVIVLALSRWQGEQSEEPTEPLSITETQTAPTRAIDSATAAAVETKPPLAERDPELSDISLEPLEIPANPAQDSRTKSAPIATRSMQRSGDHLLASKPTNAAQSGAPRLSSPPRPAPVQSAWFEYR
jgi:hypothetical protein